MANRLSDSVTKVYQAARDGTADLSDLLKRLNPDERKTALETKTKDGDHITTSLIIAACNGNLDSVKILLRYKADIEARGTLKVYTGEVGEGCTPLLAAALAGHLDVVELLIERKAEVDGRTLTGLTPLRAAAFGGHLDIVSCLVEHGADVNARDDGENTPLMATCYNGHMNVATYLVEHGAKIHLQDEDGDTCLHYAAEGDHVEVVSKLLAVGAKENPDYVNARNNSGTTPLMKTCSYGNMNVATYLVDHGANIHLQDKNGNTCLHFAAEKGHVEVVSKLLGLGAKENPDYVNATKHSGTTPLMITCYNGHMNVATYLVEHGANIHLQDKYGNTCLHYAAEGGQIEVVSKLLAVGAKENQDYVNTRNNSGTTPLMRTCYNGHMNVAAYLVEHGANIHLQDKNGDTCLHFAAEGGHVEVVSKLLAVGAKENQDYVNTRNNSGTTPLMTTCYNGHMNVATYLVEHGANIHLQDKNGNTCLHYAAQGGQIEVVSKLLAVGAKENQDYVNTRNNSGTTPLMRTCYNGHMNVAAYLVEHGANIHLQDKNGDTCLHFAAEGGHVEVVSKLLAVGAKENQDYVNTRNNSGTTLLMRTCYNGHMNVATYLVKHGANIHLQDKNGNTCLHYAAEGGQIEVVSKLLAGGAKENQDYVNTRNNSGTTPLMRTCYNGHMNVAAYLVEHGANIHLQDKNGDTCLHFAAEGGHVEVVSKLLAVGAKENQDYVNTRNNSGTTPLMRTCYNGHMNVATYLVEHGANIHLQDKNGNTCLHAAAQGGQIEVVSKLLAVGAKENQDYVNTRNNSGTTPLMRTCYNGHMNVATYLVKHGANIHLQDKNGNTCLHYAAQKGHVEVVSKLLALEAKEKQNYKRLTPLLVASNYYKIEMVEYFIKRPECTKEQRIDALELLGATIANNGSHVYDIEKAFS